MTAKQFENLAPSEGVSRRSFLAGSAATVGAFGLAGGLAGCQTDGGMTRAQAAIAYGPLPDEQFPVPAVDLDRIDRKFYRRTVRYETDAAPGTLGKLHTLRLRASRGEGLFHCDDRRRDVS